jgi:hypothetical protein
LPIVTDEAPDSDMPLAERARIIREQVETLRAILVEAERRALHPDEKLAVAELAKACAELTDAVRMLLRPLNRPNG